MTKLIEIYLMLVMGFCQSAVIGILFKNPEKIIRFFGIVLFLAFLFITRELLMKKDWVYRGAKISFLISFVSGILIVHLIM